MACTDSSEEMPSGNRAYLCLNLNMRTTVDLPDALFRKTKATAALQGSSLKELIVRAIEREVGSGVVDDHGRQHRVKLPLIRLGKGRKLDLRTFDFDDLLT